MKNLIILLYHLLQFEDNGAEETIEELYASIPNKHILIDQKVLEAGLYACNMMAEDKKFWHPNGNSFEYLLSEVLSADEEFDKFYNTITRKK